MSNQTPSPGSPRSPSPRSPRPVGKLHPIFLRLIERTIDLPEGYKASLTERQLARVVARAIMMMPEDEQAYLVSHIMTDKEIIQQRINSLELEDLERRVELSADEREFLLRDSPEPENEADGDEVEERDNGDDGVDIWEFGIWGAFDFEGAFEFEGAFDVEEVFDVEKEYDGDICIICIEKTELTVRCGCRYCRRCLREIIRKGLRSEFNFPPKCCRPFDEAVIRLAQRPELVHIFRQLSAEYAVPPHERLYCCDARCSSLIPPSAIETAPDGEDDATGVGTCPLCSKETCVACRDRSHKGLPCGEREKEEAFLDMMDEKGLVHCPRCGISLTLKDGCNHLT